MQAVLDFSRVSRELQGIMSRRRETIILLGSVFAGVGIYLQNIFEGKLPLALRSIERSAILNFSLALLIPSVIIALRLAKLHAGMVINGVFFSRLTGRFNESSGRLNWFGVSTQFFLISAFLAGFSSALLTVAVGGSALTCFLVGCATFAGLILWFTRIHTSGRAFAVSYVQQASCEQYNKEEQEDHEAESLRQANHDMLTTISFAGLIVFSAMQFLSGIGEIKSASEVSKETLERDGSFIVTLLMLCTCVMCTIAYLRLLLSLGQFSLSIDPTDRPFRVFKLTDALLGYLLHVFFLILSVHLIAAVFVSRFGWQDPSARFSYLLDALVVSISVGVYLSLMTYWSKKYHK